jgi:serine/threonine protein kinase
VTISGALTGIVIPKTPASSPIEMGATFHDRYLPKRMLGSGAMGVVYLADDRVTGREVALKLIHPALVNSASARQHFIREGLVTRDIRHPNVVAVYDVAECGERLYLVMQYLPGETLRRWLLRRIRTGIELAPFEAGIVVRNILEGLREAHRSGVVHRDLKPENIMLTGNPDEHDWSVRILDFGIAHAIGGATHLAATNAVTAGTPLYMAPEQWTAADTAGPPADVYALTAMLYELLVGVVPGPAWKAPSRERDDIVPDFDELVETGLSDRPARRYQTAEQYLEAVTGKLAGLVRRGASNALARKRAAGLRTRSCAACGGTGKCSHCRGRGVDCRQCQERLGLCLVCYGLGITEL